MSYQVWCPEWGQEKDSVEAESAEDALRQWFDFQVSVGGFHDLFGNPKQGDIIVMVRAPGAPAEKYLLAGGSWERV